jgi:hypothetical protein
MMPTEGTPATATGMTTNEAHDDGRHDGESDRHLECLQCVATLALRALGAVEAAPGDPPRAGWWLPVPFSRPEFLGHYLGQVSDPLGALGMSFEFLHVRARLAIQ